MRQAQFDQLVFEEIDFGLIGRLPPCRRILGQLDQQGTALVDVGRATEIDRLFRHSRAVTLDSRRVAAL
jgi:hypothetical protein